MVASPPRSPQPSAGWTLAPYITEQGRSELSDWLQGLRKSHFRRWVDFEKVKRPLLETRGPLIVGPPLWEALKGGLFEIRWWKCRIYCSIKDPKTVIMYRGAIKYWTKFLDEDREFCERCRIDAEGAEYDHEARNFRYLARQKNHDR